MKDNNYLWIHYVKSIAIFMVVMLHVSATYQYDIYSISKGSWNVVNFYNSLSRYCVPLFFMASGFLLLRFDESLVVFFKKRISRILIPFLFWSVFYFAWKVFYLQSNTISIGGFFRILFFPSIYHLWFIYAIVGCYLFVPFVRKVSLSGNYHILILYCVIWVFSSSIIPFLDGFYKLNSRYDFSYAGGYIGYFILGFIFGGIRFGRFSTIISFVAIVICTSITYRMTEFFSFKNGYLFLEYLDYMSPAIVAGSIAWFVFIKCIVGFLDSYKKDVLNKFIVSLSSFSFGIYLVHVAVMDVVLGLARGYSISGWYFFSVYVPFVTILVLSISYFIVMVFSGNKILKKVV